MSGITAFGVAAQLPIDTRLPGQTPFGLNPASALPTHRSADVGADLIEVGTGVLKIPAAQFRLLWRDDHGDEDETAEQRKEKHDEPHGVIPWWVR